MRKTVLITGGSRGIGAACAREFASRGYGVIICYNRGEAAAKALEAELNNRVNGGMYDGMSGAMHDETVGGVYDGMSGRMHDEMKKGDGGDRLCAAALKADITKSDQVAAMFSAARKIFGKIDVLVNNAGVSEFALFTDIEEEQWDRMMDTNCKGTYLCTREALSDMLSQKKGAVVNVSSMWGQVGASCEVHYSASKAAVIGMTKALAKELGPSQIRVNCVAPGVIETDMMAAVTEEAKEELRQETPLLRLGSPEDIAKVVCFLASDDAGFITGQVIGASGGFII